ncbi:fluoride efflux transporter CrcB [Metabacillus sp. Hm71]|uniref:fluoride efflux transporter CrcB n=1 Tax=Metabacillus sp. Hm71 TaxID=3450743 RepID=UPI003F430757
MIYFLVGIAGALGAILRYLIGLMFFTNSLFPLATLSINLIGSFLLAWLTTNLFRRLSFSSVVKTAIGTGFVGSFTTFSTVSVETVELFKNESFLIGILYVLVNIIGGILMSQLGFKLNVGEQQV